MSVEGGLEAPIDWTSDNWRKSQCQELRVGRAENRFDAMLSCGSVEWGV